jgi:hypothetical protein
MPGHEAVLEEKPAVCPLPNCGMAFTLSGSIEMVVPDPQNTPGV